jgi:hypothetical protein
VGRFIHLARLPAVLMLMMASGGLAWSQDAEKSNFATDFAAAARAAGGQQFCEIVVQSNGVMAANVLATRLSSQGYGGEPARADVTTNTGSFYASIDRPNGFSLAPNGGNTDVVFTTSLSGTGKTNFADAPGDSRVKLKNGLTKVEVNLEAAKQSGPFPAGHYRVELTLRCE